MLGVLTTLFYIVPIALDIIGFVIGDYAMMSVGVIWLMTSLFLTGMFVLKRYVDERRKNNKGV